jgi:hypothetical protein
VAQYNQAKLREALHSVIGDPQVSSHSSVRQFLLNEIKYIQSAPSLTGCNVPVDVVDIDQHLVRYWHSYIQPFINAIGDRADRGWDWRLICSASNLIGGVLRQRTKGLAIVVNLMPDFPAMIPVALLHLVNRYPHFRDHRQVSTFLWYLSDAPREALQQLKELNTGIQIFTEDKIPKMLGALALDTALIHSFRESNQGRLGLHAAPEGGQRLLDWYKDKGMIQIADSERLPPGLRRILKGNDGRYFCYTEEGALEAAQRVDAFR